ncbi:MIP/aquaporin family protein [Acinetobacter haemolyticus]|uniref:MIP/aquaporin family protein n=1 Tax=Acinetobacter haemolyticus TaxID=29430 RepID=UPI0002EAAE5D|nr:MIP/aquaporin family protein [Acinetobacter haemolyticus]NAS08265.1 MIP family channel protein [Acinetobacter haemolyticus]
MSRSEPTLLGQCVAEFFATAIFLSFGIGVVAALKLAGADLGLWEISIVWGLAVYLSAGISGAHLNPAVTIALALFAGFDKRKVPFYIIAQVAGAATGALMVYGLYSSLFLDFEQTHHMVRGSVESLELAGIFSTYPHHLLSLGQAFMVEMFITMLLLWLIMAIGDDSNGLPRGPLAPILVGLLVAVIGASFGPLTGFAMNPARDFGPKIVAYFSGWGPVAFTGGRDIPYFIVPILAPIVGACLGVLGYKLFFSHFLLSNKVEETHPVEKQVSEMQ